MAPFWLYASGVKVAIPVFGSYVADPDRFICSLKLSLFTTTELDVRFEVVVVDVVVGAAIVFKTVNLLNVLKFAKEVGLDWFEVDVDVRLDIWFVLVRASLVANESVAFVSIDWVKLELMLFSEDDVFDCVDLEVTFEDLFWSCCTILSLLVVVLSTWSVEAYVFDLDDWLDVSLLCWLIPSFSLDCAVFVTSEDICLFVLLDWFDSKLAELTVSFSEFLIVVEFWLATVSLLDEISEVIGVSEAANAWWLFNILNVNAPPTRAVVFAAPFFILWPFVFSVAFSCISFLLKNGSPIVFNNSISLILAFTQLFPDLYSFTRVFCCSRLFL